jgi:E3 ubiquitin-protein ligase UBR7
MGIPVKMDPIREEEDDYPKEDKRKESQVPQSSQTADEYGPRFYEAVEVDVLKMFRRFINEQLELEADAREILPYKFDTCTKPIGPLRQNVFACLTCNPPPATPAQVYTPAGICYSCSISCHGDHNLAELFSRRNFTCDCGTTRMQSSICTLRSDENTGEKGSRSELPATTNHYNQNFQNKFCGCGEEYDAHSQKGTMFQCLGLGTVETGGCSEDWWHPECLMGLPKDWRSTEAKPDTAQVKPEGEEETEGAEDHPVPAGFPNEDDFEFMICYKCVESNPWIKRYADSPGFLAPVHRSMQSHSEASVLKDLPQATEKPSLKRKASEDGDVGRAVSPSKRTKGEEEVHAPSAEPKVDSPKPVHKHDHLPPAPAGTFSLFLKEDFREHFCHCPKCYRNLVPHQQLLEEEDTYEPPLSESDESEAPGSGARSQGTGSLLERGEAALSGVDRVRAIEGVMVYNQLKDKVKAFLKPFAESGQPVGAEDIKAYFEKLRGDDAAIKEAGAKAAGGGGNDGEGGSNRKGQSGY